MMNDRNKTALTHRVTAVAAAALDSMGCKPVETEVAISPGWIADVASYWYPSLTEAKRFKLDKVTLPARLVDESEGELDMRLRCWCAGPLTVAAEVKATAGDFQQDTKWSRPHPANICILAFPQGVVSPEEVPEGWYGLETTANGTKVRKWHRSCIDVHPQHPGLQLDFVAQVGIRRDHRTRERSLRDWSKAYRATDAEKMKRYSAAKLLDSLARWLQGSGSEPDRPLRDVLNDLGIKKTPQYLEPIIDYFEALRDGAMNEER